MAFSRHTGTLAILVAVAIVAVAAAAAMRGNDASPPHRRPQKVQAEPGRLLRGEYLARAADCAACHQVEGGQAYAGGYPLRTPFGTIYGTNITPDPDHGIGRWTADEFHRALTEGKAPRGRNLYPAMPYTAYHAMSREDADLIYAYLMNQRPSPRPNREPDIPFPLDLRVLMWGWNLLFFDRDPLPAASRGQSPQWLRGQYLVNVLGHCAECHTPRGRLGQLQRDYWLQGYALGRYMAPDITPEGLARNGWNAADLQRFMRTGLAPQAVASDEMYPVIVHSSRYLGDEDLAAMTTFLLGDAASGAGPDTRAPARTPPQESPGKTADQPAPAAPPGADGQQVEPGRQTYLNLCAGCHGAQGEGRPGTMPALAGNTSLRMEDPRNLIMAVLHGFPGNVMPGATTFSPMPGFSRRLDDREVAGLANYLRTQWGGQSADVTAEEVRGLRAQ